MDVAAGTGGFGGVRDTSAAEPGDGDLAVGMLA